MSWSRLLSIQVRRDRADEKCRWLVGSLRDHGERCLPRSCFDVWGYGGKQPERETDRSNGPAGTAPYRGGGCREGGALSCCRRKLHDGSSTRRRWRTIRNLLRRTSQVTNPVKGMFPQAATTWRITALGVAALEYAVTVFDIAHPSSIYGHPLVRRILRFFTKRSTHACQESR